LANSQELDNFDFQDKIAEKCADCAAVTLTLAYKLWSDVETVRAIINKVRDIEVSLEFKLATSLRGHFFAAHHIRDEIKDMAASVVFVGEMECLLVYVIQVSDLTPLSGLKHLKELHIDRMPITDIKPISGLVNLKTLSMEQAQVSDFTPLSKLVNLEKLSLRGCRIKDLAPLRELKNLKELDLRNTEIESLEPLHGLGNLKVLLVENTPLSNNHELAEQQFSLQVAPSLVSGLD
jgi:Leucine-rich repeat (LRR) protein